MLFNFTLTPVDELVSPARDRHWFDLSEGCYWLRLGKAEVFRFAQGVHGGGASPYVLYYVGRLWEDLLELLPVIAEPIPDQLAERLATFDDWLGSIERLKAWAGQHQDSDPAWAIWSEATDWFFARQLDTGYLKDPPRIWLWTHRDQVHVRWDSSPQETSAPQIWATPRGYGQLSTPEFLNEVRSFDERLMRAMRDRCATMRGSPAGRLMEEQANRELCLGRALGPRTKGEATPWEDVLRALDRGSVDATNAGLC